MDNSTQINKNINATVLNPMNYDNSTVLNNIISEQNIVDIGVTLGEKYIVESKMSVSTGEADLYICNSDNEKYVAKIYRRQMAIKDEVTKKLMSIDSPYVAKVYMTGEYYGLPYEIIPYYKNGSLEGKTFDYEDLKKSIIPALNEGLKVLHDNGIIHKDLKPSNIMLADNGSDVAIIDFGISSVREDGNTVIVTRTGMTPEYSAPETFKNLFLSESDYYSFGITLYTLFCGHTPYSRMTQEEIEQFISIQKLPLPADMPEELKVLISALTYPDITNRRDKSNPNRRWGYEETSKWCAGVKIPFPGEPNEEMPLSENIKPYKFLGKMYRDKRKLVTELLVNWEDGKKQLFRGLLSSYFKSFDAEIAGYCMDAEDALDKEDEDVLFMRTMYMIEPTVASFYWKGKHYQNLQIMGKEFLKALMNNDNITIEYIDELIKKGVISEYIYCVDKESLEAIKSVKAIESNYRTFASNKRQKSINYYTLAYLLSGNRRLYKDGVTFESISSLTSFMKDLYVQKNDLFEKFCYKLIDEKGNLDVQFESWLIALGKRKELEEWKNNLKSN